MRVSYQAILPPVQPAVPSQDSQLNGVAAVQALEETLRGL
jgi:hypothetical protein